MFTYMSYKLLVNFEKKSSLLSRKEVAKHMFYITLAVTFPVIDLYLIMLIIDTIFKPFN